MSKFGKSLTGSFLNSLKPGLEKLSKGGSKYNQQSFNQSGAGGSFAGEALLDAAEVGEVAEAPMQLFSQISFEDIKEREVIDQKTGFFRIVEGEPRLGWLVTLHDVRCYFVPTILL
jgi:hypothetical protein